MRYYIIAGEASGDLHGSNLMRGLYAEDPQADIRFWGGGLMDEVYHGHQDGTGLVKDYKDGAVIGFTQILIHARAFAKRFTDCTSDILAWKPDVVILIDYPGFNFRVAEFAHKAGFKVFYYIAPKVWASRESRVKKLKAYVDKLNELQKGTEFEDMELEDVIKKSSGGIYNQAAQIWNHTFFWNCMKPQGGGEPSGALADAIKKKWGSHADFKIAFVTSAVGNFGSGGTWLVKKADGSVDIVNMGAAGTPLTTGDTPVLTVDVWEHAYYIDYRNARQKFVETFFDKLVNWDFAAKNFG